MIQDLLDNNRRVRAERDAMEIQRNECKEALRQVQSDLDKARSECQALHKRVSTTKAPHYSVPLTDCLAIATITSHHTPKGWVCGYR